VSSEAHVCILASTRTVCKQLYEPVQLVYAHIIAVFLLLLEYAYYYKLVEVCIRVVCCTTWCIVCIASTSLFTYELVHCMLF